MWVVDGGSGRGWLLDVALRDTCVGLCSFAFVTAARLHAPGLSHRFTSGFIKLHVTGGDKRRCSTGSQWRAARATVGCVLVKWSATASSHTALRRSSRSVGGEVWVGSWWAVGERQSPWACMGHGSRPNRCLWCQVRRAMIDQGSAVGTLGVCTIVWHSASLPRQIRHCQTLIS